MKKIAASLTPLALAAQSQGVLADPMHGPWMGGGGWWMGPVMMLAGFILLVLIVFGLWRVIFGNRDNSDGRGTALNVLRDRFARGEIDEQEFESRKKALRR
jgi:putative membrane protein